MCLGKSKVLTEKWQLGIRKKIFLHWALLESLHLPPADSPSENTFLFMTTCKARQALGELHGSLCVSTCLQQNQQPSSASGILMAGGGVKRKKGTAWFSDPSWSCGAARQRCHLWTRKWRKSWYGRHWDGINMEMHYDIFIHSLFRI